MDHSTGINQKGRKHPRELQCQVSNSLLKGCDTAATRCPLPSLLFLFPCPTEQRVRAVPAPSGSLTSAEIPNCCFSAGLRNEGAGHLTKTTATSRICRDRFFRAVAALWYRLDNPWVSLRSAEGTSLWRTEWWIRFSLGLKGERENRIPGKHRN